MYLKEYLRELGTSLYNDLTNNSIANRKIPQNPLEQLLKIINKLEPGFGNIRKVDVFIQSINTLKSLLENNILSKFEENIQKFIKHLEHYSKALIELKKDEGQLTEP